MTRSSRFSHLSPFFRFKPLSSFSPPSMTHESSILRSVIDKLDPCSKESKSNREIHNSKSAGRLLKFDLVTMAQMLYTPTTHAAWVQRIATLLVTAYALWFQPTARVRNPCTPPHNWLSSIHPRTPCYDVVPSHLVSIEQRKETACHVYAESIVLP